MQIQPVNHDTEPLVPTPSFSVLKSVVAQARRIGSGGYDGFSDEPASLSPTPEQKTRAGRRSKISDMVDQRNRRRPKPVSPSSSSSSAVQTPSSKQLMEFVLERSNSQNELPESKNSSNHEKTTTTTSTKGRRRRTKRTPRRSRSRDSSGDPPAGDETTKKNTKKKKEKKPATKTRRARSPRRSRSRDSSVGEPPAASDEPKSRRARSRSRSLSRGGSVPPCEEAAPTPRKPLRGRRRPRSRSGDPTERATTGGEPARRSGLSRHRSLKEVTRKRSGKQEDPLNATLHSLDYLRSQDKEHLRRRSRSGPRRRTPPRPKKNHSSGDEDVNAFVRSMESLKLKEMTKLQQNLERSSSSVQFLPSLITSEDQKGLSSSLVSLDLKYLEAEEEVVLVKGKGELISNSTSAPLSASWHGVVPVQPKTGARPKTKMVVKQEQKPTSSLSRSTSLEELYQKSTGSKNQQLSSASCHGPGEAVSQKARPPLTRRNKSFSRATFDGFPSVLKATSDRRTYRTARERREGSGTSMKIKMPKSRSLSRSLSLNKASVDASKADAHGRIRLRRGNSETFQKTSSINIGPVLQAAIQ